ncbi:hypothetical protein PHSC3_001665 [Chlamydiales bacterium STE3]|nr:hypothetical protein PHSC3_001665 [Chlamydiales bacterium STE3]
MFERLIPNAAASYQISGPHQQSSVATTMGFKLDIGSDITNSYGNHSVCKLNIMGYIPIVSTFSGAYRTFIGLAYFIKSAVCRIFDTANRAQHREVLKIAAANMGHGLLEIVPVIGNLFVLNIDTSRMMHRWSDHGHPYGDSNTIPIFPAIDYVGSIFIVGTVVNLARALFFTTHVLVNAPLAMTGNKKSCQAVKLGLTHVAIGVFESIPIVGSISSCMRHTLIL